MSSSNATPIESNSSNHEKDETHVNDSESSSHLVQHSSKSSLFFYYFSFCPPFPPLGKPREVLQHPLTLYFLGIICAVLAGLAFPALDLLYGIWTNGITLADATESEIKARSNYVAWIMTIVGFADLILCWLFLTLFTTASHRLSQSLRHAYISSTLAQDAEHFDQHGAGEIATKAGKDVNTVRVGLGEKSGYLFWSLSTLIASIVTGFVKAPKVAGFLFVLIPLTVATFAVLGWAGGKAGAPALKLEGRASSYVEQILSSVRVVQSFGMEKNLVQRYDQAMLGPLQKFGMRKATVRGLELGTVYFVLNLCYSTAFWWGSIQITHGLPNGTMLTAFWNFLNSLFSLANVVPHISGIFDAFTTLAALRRAIERQPKIDVRDQGGLKLDGSPDFRPSIEFKDVTFAYPSRPTVASLRGVSFFAEHGKVIALVGPSGGGKSSIANLVLREYDPLTSTIPNESDVKDSEAVGDLGLEETDGSQKISEKKKKKAFFGNKNSGDEKVIDEKQIEEGKESERIKGGGEVLFAGQDVKNLNLTWLRSQIAVVQQNPQMFSASIFENVAAGLTGTEFEYRPDRDGLQEIDSTSSPEDFTFSLNPQDQEKEDKKALEAIEKKYNPRTQEIRRKVRDALSKAQALEFVEKLPEGIDTLVSGGRTGLLSGGQRQRIAIARALIREPAVILLDEGTSALDSHTETKIKLMLEEEQKKRGMTTILIAHRLSTIQHADQILVLKKGQVVDRGTHDELFKASRADQTYRTMVNQQRAIAEPDQDDSSDEKKPLSTSSSDELEQSERNDVLDQEAAIEREAEAQELLDLNASDGNTTKVGGTTVVGSSDDVEPWNKPKPTPIRRTTSRPGDHRQWQVSGRTAALNQLEHTAEASNTAEMNDNRSTHSTVSVAPSRVPTVSVPVEKSTLVKRFCGYLWRQRLYFSIGVIGALVASASFPVAGWMTGKVVSSLSIEGDNHRLRSEANKWSLYFLVLALASLVIVAIQSCFLEFGSEHISRRLKTQGLSALVRQEIGWFDSESNQAGGLTAAVSGTHPANVSAATGLVTSQILISLGNLIGSVILAFILSWQQAIVTLPPIIVLFLSGYLNIKMLSKYEDISQVPADRAASYISENVDAIKTVQALGREHETMRVFDHRAKSDPKRTGYLIWGAGGFAISQAMVFLLCALIFFYGGKLLAEGTVDVTKLYATFEAVIIGSFGAGRIFTFVNDFGRAKSSFKSVTAWCMRQPRIASIQAPEGKVGDLKPAEDIVLDDVEMRYPQRPKHPALRSLNLTIKAGSTVAFCGTSGSGKSSILALLQRFYDPSRGTIEIGGVDVRAIPLEEFRSQMAFVSQEPTLYGGGSIAWNLRLGSTDPDSVTQEEIEDACEAACILDFVRGLPEGFETDVGLKGAQLSGGQKQRLCIARALIRKPKILLLDEATSALDAESELSVQRALENASKGRTTISIAHRLSTIRNADEIHVVEDGNIIESGSHDELLRRRGRYLELIEAQL